VVEAWREALRLCVTICPDDGVDRILQAITVPQAGESAEIARARGILGALCLADEPNASAEVADRVIEAFVGIVRDNDGTGSVRTGVDRAAMELTGTRWASPFRAALVQAFCRRGAADRGRVGGLAAMVVGTLLQTIRSVSRVGFFTKARQD
jgi:hypothetical protein